MALWTQAITASADDAQELAGTVTINGVNVNCNGTTAYVGFIFQNCPAPKGSIVSSAYLTLYFVSGSFDDPEVRIHCQANNTDAVFAATTNNISSRTLTSASVLWDATGLGTGWKNSPDFAAAVQEQIDASDYDQGDRIIVIGKGETNNSLFRVNAYDNGSNIPTLTMIYTPPVSPVLRRRPRTYVRL